VVHPDFWDLAFATLIGLVATLPAFLLWCLVYAIYLCVEEDAINDVLSGVKLALTQIVWNQRRLTLPHYTTTRRHHLNVSNSASSSAASRTPTGTLPLDPTGEGEASVPQKKTSVPCYGI